MAMTGYLVVPPSHLVGSTVQGQVSHTEEDVFWIQTEPDKVAALVVRGGGHRVGVWGECVEEKETEVVVQFADFGNTATLFMENVRKRSGQGDGGNCACCQL